MTTLLALFRKHNITLPDIATLSPTIKSLLEIDLRKIPGYNGKDSAKINQLLYYTSVFIWGHAQVNPQTMLYLYTGFDQEKLEALAKHAAEQIALLPQNKSLALTYPKLDTMHEVYVPPSTLAIMCFENCPILRELFNQIIPSRPQKLSLCATSNPFILGEYYYIQNSPIILNQSDTLCFAHLHQIANLYNRGNESSELMSTYAMVRNNLSTELRNAPDTEIHCITKKMGCVQIVNVDYLVRYLLASAHPTFNQLNPTMLNLLFEAIPYGMISDTTIEHIKRHPAILAMKNMSYLEAMLGSVESQLVELNKALKTASSEEKTLITLKIRWLEMQDFVYYHLQNEVIASLAAKKEIENTETPILNQSGGTPILSQSSTPSSSSNTPSSSESDTPSSSSSNGTPGSSENSTPSSNQSRATTPRISRNRYAFSTILSPLPLSRIKEEGKEEERPRAR